MFRALQLGLILKDMVLLRFSATDRARRRLIQRLSLSHGLPQKIGQLLATTELSSSNPEYTALTEDKPTLGPTAALKEISRQVTLLHPRPILSFREIDPHGISASIGQVHRATLSDGRVVAVKIQHPGIAAAVQTDLRALGWLTFPVGNLRRGFDQAAYRREIGEKLAQEIDYRHEARNLARYRAETATLKGLLLPELISELSSSALITQTWLAGERFSATSSYSLASRRQIATTLLRLFFHTVFNAHFIHADPHPGNYRFTARGEVGLLDFGCLHEIPAPVADTWLELIRRVRDHDLSAEPIWQAYQRLGFDVVQLAPLREKLPLITTTLLAPFAEDRPFQLSQWKMAEQLTALLGEHRMAFRLAGPAHHLYLIRAFQGLLRYLKALDTPLNWPRLLDESINRLALPPHPDAAQNRSHSHAPQSPEESPVFIAKHLCLSVFENGAQRIRLTFPAGALPDLPELIPDDIAPRLVARHIDAAHLTREAIARSAPPGEIFSLSDGPRHFRVWLE